jgi:hypothetical protein
MKKLLSLFLLTTSLLSAQSVTLNLGPRGKLTLFLLGDWKIDTSNFSQQGVGTVTIAPSRPSINASCTIAIGLPEPDRYDTKARLKLRVEADNYGAAQESVERKAIAKEFNLTTGFGFYCSFTDPQLVGKPPEPGNYKVASVGKIKLAPDTIVDVSIMADSFRDEPYQQLLGAIEGMEYSR